MSATKGPMEPADGNLIIKRGPADPNSEEERSLRKQLGEQMGVEFCEPAELSQEVDKALAEAEASPMRKSSEQSNREIARMMEGENIVSITTDEILIRLQSCYDQLGRDKRNSSKQKVNRARNAMKLAANALIQIVNRAGTAEAEVGRLRKQVADLQIKCGERTQ